MPTRPKKVTMQTNVMNILNAIRNNASNEYRDYVPPMTDTSQLREIGSIAHHDVHIVNFCFIFFKLALCPDFFIADRPAVFRILIGVGII